MIRPPERIWIYHIVHVDRLPSIIEDGFLWSDAEVRDRASPGTSVGMAEIKDRRLRNRLASHPGLVVGACVPFYFCPRSVMLYVLHRGNHPGITYRGGQDPIVHLVADMREAAGWAERNGLRWAFTLSNAGSGYFEDRADMDSLAEIEWDAVGAKRWSGGGVDGRIKEGKQAEFLVEHRFPWGLVAEIGVASQRVGEEVTRLLAGHSHRPDVRVMPSWYC